MSKTRMEAFSDGVIAIIITIMVLELRTPEGTGLEALRGVFPTLLSYLFSFVFLGIYWSNHHHLLQAVNHVNGPILWANLHLLFWLSLTPFVTKWMGGSHFASGPVAMYGVVLLCAALAYFVLTRALIAHHGPGSKLAAAVGADRKGKLSLAIYALAIPLAFAAPWSACALYAVVAIMWLIPDRRIEHILLAGGTTRPAGE
jgi:TMEM175 potassium channel family protein